MINYLEKRKKYLIYLPLGLYWVLLLFLTSIPGVNIPTQITFNDKLEHITAFMGLGLLLSLTLKVQNKYQYLKLNYIKTTLAIGVCYGVLDELHQLFIAGRSCDIWDVTADTTGIVTGLIIISIIIGIDKKRESRIAE